MSFKESNEIVWVDDDCILPIERRLHERVIAYLRVRWEGMLGSHEGTVSDISEGGCFVMSDAAPSARELLRLEIELHTGEWIKMWGEVTNIFDGIGFGIRYTEIDEEVEPGKYDKGIKQIRALKSAVAALKKFDASVVRRYGGESVAILVGLAEYNSLLMLTLPKVNKGMLSLPDCRKKTSLKLAVEAYADAG
ncbi:MAG TPA: PilZ domain-containing protein, partial [Pyrinomonadaceae bacterium]|nr:PilZ domain-containing protein [Pyrinomonadaceae bacterium]